MNRFLRSRRLYMLVVLPILLLALTFTSYLHLAAIGMVETGARGYISLFHPLGTFAKIVLGDGLILGILCLLFLINERFKLLQQRSTLPLLLYLLLTSGLLCQLYFGDILLAVLLLALALDRFQIAMNQIKSNSVLFDFGALVMLAVLVSPKFVLLLLWAFCTMLFSGRSTLKDIVALCLGFLTPLFFLVFYYFWTDRLQQLPDMFLQNLSIGEYFYSFSLPEWIRLAILFFVLLFALLHFFSRFAVLVLVHRRLFFALVSLLFFLGVICLVFPFKDLSFVYIFALPLSLLYSQFILDQRSAWIGNVVFCLLAATATLANIA